MIQWLWVLISTVDTACKFHAGSWGDISLTCADIQRRRLTLVEIISMLQAGSVCNTASLIVGIYVM